MSVYNDQAQPAVLPARQNKQLAAEVSAVEALSRIDVLRLLGKKATKLIVTGTNGDVITLRLNSAERQIGPWISGIYDTNGNLSTLPARGSTNSSGVHTIGADAQADRDTNVWTGGGLTITFTLGASAVWNSYDDYGELPITSFVLDSLNGGATIATKFIL